MALTIPHNSQAGIAVASGGRAANHVGAGAFMTPGQSAMPNALNHLSRGIDKLGGAVNEMLLDRQRMQNATDLLADKIDYENSLREFDSNYRQTKQGTDARTAAEDYDAFHKERLDILHKKWGGNPYLMESVSRMAEGIRAPSMNRAVAYRDQQEEAHKEAVGKAEWQQTLSKLADPSLTFAERQAALQQSEASLRMLSGQRWEEDAEGRGRWVGGRNVDAELERRRQTFHGEQVETLLAQGKTGEASKYVRANTGAFGERSNDLLGKIRAVAEHNAARGREESRRAMRARMDGVYSQWRDEARQQGFTLEETERFIATRISDDLKKPEERHYAMQLNMQDMQVERMRRDANDEVLGRQYREYVQQNNLLPSQAAAGIDAIQGISEAGRDKLEKSLSTEAQKVTPQNTSSLLEMKRLIDTHEIVDQAQIDAFAFRHGLTDKQTQDGMRYMQDGGNAGNVTVSRVEGIFKRMGQGKTMPDDLYQMALDNLEPGKPATDERIRQTIANLYMDGEAMGSGVFGLWNGNENYSDAVREGRADSWLPDVSKEERAAITGILRSRGITVTDERIREYKRVEIMGLPVRGGNAK